MNKLSAVSLSLIGLFWTAQTSLGATILYVKPDGTGGGTSWSDAAGLEAALATAKTAGGAYDLYLAQGHYKPTAILRLTDGISLYGSFAGQSMDETPATRNIAATPTVLDGDVDGNDYWERFDGETGAITKLPDAPIVVDGKVSVPAYAGDYDTYVPAWVILTQTPKTTLRTDNLSRLIVMTASATCTIDGLTLVGGGNGYYCPATTEDGFNMNYGGALLVAQGATATIRDCRFVGCTSYTTPVYFDKEATVSVDGLTMEYCRGFDIGAMSMDYGAAVTIANSTFRGNARELNYQTYDCSGSYAAVALRADNGLKIHDTSFVRNVCIKSYCHALRPEATPPKECVSAAVLYMSYADALRSGDDKFVNLKFIGNASWSKYGRALPLVAHSEFLDNYQLNGCLFQGNLCKTAVPAANPHPTEIGQLYNATTRFSIKNTTVVSNRIVVTLANAVPELRVAPVVTRNNCHLLNDTFSDNTVEVGVPDGTAVRAARVALALKTEEDTPTENRNVVAFNCTFAGEVPLPDLVDVGVRNDKYCTAAFNTIFWATGAAADVPRCQVFGPGSGNGNGVELARCIVRAPELLGSGVWNSDFVIEEDPLLEPLAYLNAEDKIPVIRCGARPPALTKGYDVRYWEWWTQVILGAFIPGEDTGRTRANIGISSSWPLVKDALGADRPSGGFLLGALQQTGADDKATVVARARPLGRGTLDGSTHSITRVLAPDTVSASITAAPVDGQAFHSWRDAEMNLLSATPEYAPTAATVGSFYADAWFSAENGEFALTPKDDLQDALNLVAADGAGTIRLGAGVYCPFATLTTAATDVRIVGEEGVVITADPSGDAYWKDGAGAAVPDGQGGTLRVFSNGVFNEPTPAEGEICWKATAGTGKLLAKFFDLFSTEPGQGSGQTLAFENVTFALGAADFGRANVSLANCRVLACAGDANAAVLSCRANLTMTDSSFIGNSGYAVLRPDESGQSYNVYQWIASNCVFKCNGSNGWWGPGLNGHVSNIDVVDTVFVHNSNISAGNGGLVQTADGALIRVLGCTFEQNVFSNTCAVLYYPYNRQGVLSNSVFVANRVVGTPTDNSWGVGIVNSHQAGFIAYNTTFLSNLVDVARTAKPSSYDIYVAAAVNAYSAFGLVNCHLEGNRVRLASTAEGLSAFACTARIQRQRRYPFIGNTFYNNDVTDCELFLDRQSTSYGWYVINSVFWNDAADYVPFGCYDLSKCYFDVYNCVVKNAPPAGSTGTAVVTTYYNCQTTDPHLGALIWKDGRAYRPIDRGSAKKKGAPFGVSTDGLLAFRYSNGMWYRCDQPWTKTTFAANTGDMFGTLPKDLARPDIGAVQNSYPQYGLMLLVR